MPGYWIERMSWLVDWLEGVRLVEIRGQSRHWSPSALLNSLGTTKMDDARSSCEASQRATFRGAEAPAL